MIVTTKAIVINSLKYGDADLIVKCYTEVGVKSYLLKGVLKSKKGKLKSGYFQPLTQLELVVKHSNKGGLNYIREAKVLHPYKTIHTDIVKQTIAMFLSEMLSKALYEEEANNELFTYLETAFLWLDTHDEVSNFHLLFLLNLTRHLGFYPQKIDANYNYFDLEEGFFTDSNLQKHTISGQKLTLFKTLLGTNFDALPTLKISGKERFEMLEVLLQYFQLHLPVFSTPKSLTVLKSVFA